MSHRVFIKSNFQDDENFQKVENPFFAIVELKTSKDSTTGNIFKSFEFLSIPILPHSLEIGPMPPSSMERGVHTFEPSHEGDEIDEFVPTIFERAEDAEKAIEQIKQFYPKLKLKVITMNEESIPETFRQYGLYSSRPTFVWTFTREIHDWPNCSGYPLTYYDTTSTRWGSNKFVFELK